MIEDPLTFPYRPDVKDMYWSSREYIKHSYALWRQSYGQAAEHFGIPYDGTLRVSSEMPWKMEDRTYAEARTTGVPYRGFVIMGPQDVGKTDVKGFLHEYFGYATTPNYITRPLRPNEVAGVDAIPVSEEELAHLHAQGDLLSMSDQVHCKNEPPYKSGFSKELFLQTQRNDKPFYIEKSIGGWQQVREALQGSPDFTEEDFNGMRVIFLLPPAPHVLALRAIQRIDSLVTQKANLR